MVRQIVYNEEWQCPQCSGMLAINMDVGDKYLYDVCGGVDGCGFKRKKLKNDQGEGQREEDA